MAAESVVHRALVVLVHHRLTPKEIDEIASGAYQYEDEYQNFSAAQRAYMVDLARGPIVRVPERRLDLQAACLVIKSAPINDSSSSRQVLSAYRNPASRHWHTALQHVLDKLRAIREAMHPHATDAEIMGVMEHRVGALLASDLRALPSGVTWWSDAEYSRGRRLTDEDLTRLHHKGLFLAIDAGGSGVQLYKLHASFGRSTQRTATGKPVLLINGDGHVHGTLTPTGYFYTSPNFMHEFYLMISDFGTPFLAKGAWGQQPGPFRPVLFIQTF